MAASKLQRWSIYLSNFEFEIKNTAWKTNEFADVFSRLANPERVQEETEFSYLNFVHSEFQKPIRLENIARQSEKDPILREVIRYVHKVWPDKNKYEDELKPYL